MSAVLTTTDNAQQVRDAMRTEREERRAVLKQMVEVSPNTKLGRKAVALLLDVDILDDRIKDCGGDAGMERILFAQVASGVRLRDWCEHYGIERGLLWAWISETEERLQKYYRALRGVADEYVAEVIDIADDGTNDTYVDENGNRKTDTDVIARSKLRVDARLKIAEKYDQPRFGKQTKVTHEHKVDFGEQLRLAQERVERGRLIEGEVL